MLYNNECSFIDVLHFLRGLGAVCIVRISPVIISTVTLVCGGPGILFVYLTQGYQDQLSWACVAARSYLPHSWAR